MFDAAWPLPPFGRSGRNGSQDWQREIKCAHQVLYGRTLTKVGHAIRKFTAEDLRGRGCVTECQHMINSVPYAPLYTCTETFGWFEICHDCAGKAMPRWDTQGSGTSRQTPPRADLMQTHQTLKTWSQYLAGQTETLLEGRTTVLHKGR
jgi:hypothetical protein